MDLLLWGEEDEFRDKNVETETVLRVDEMLESSITVSWWLKSISQKQVQMNSDLFPPCSVGVSTRTTGSLCSLSKLMRIKYGRVELIIRKSTEALPNDGCESYWTVI